MSNEFELANKVLQHEVTLSEMIKSVVIKGISEFTSPPMVELELVKQIDAVLTNMRGTHCILVSNCIETMKGKGWFTEDEIKSFHVWNAGERFADWGSDLVGYIDRHM